MAKKSFSLGISLGVLDKVSAPLEKIQGKFQKFSSRVEGYQNKIDLSKKKMGLPKLKDTASEFGDSLKPIGIGLAAIGAIGVGAFAMIKSSAEKLTELDDLSKTTGFGIKSLQELRYAAQQMGSSAEEMDSGLKTFTEGMGKARAGSGKLLGFLEKINPAFKAQLMNTKSNEEAFNLMMKSLQKVTDPQKKLALASVAFGTAGESLARVSGEGAEKLKAMREEARKFGLASEEDAEAAGAFDDGLHKVMFALEAVKNRIAVGLMPVLTEMFNKLLGWVANNQTKILAFANYLTTSVPKAIEFCANAFKTITESNLLKFILWIIDKIGVMNVVFIALGAYIGGTLLSVIVSFVALLTNLGIVAAGTWAALLGPIGWGIAAIAAVGAAVYLLWKYWDDIVNVLQSVWDWTKKIMGLGFDKLKAVFSFGSKESNEVTNDITNVSKNALNPGTNLGARELGAQRLAGDALAPKGAQSETKITVDFANAPKGTRTEVSNSKNSEIDLSMGYSLVGAT